jgi:predicted metal-dependent hydrolase
MQIILEGIVIPVERKRIRNLYIRFSAADKTVKVTAPQSMPDSEIELFVRSKLPWLKKQMARADRMRPAEETPLPEDAEALLRSRMEALIPECERIVGQHAQGWRIREMKTRWGSCSRRTGFITVNLQLVSYPDDCLKYLLIHELTHFWVGNHGVYFKKRMDRYYPEWKAVRKKLNRTA